MSKSIYYVPNVCPGCDDRAQHHKAEGEERHASDGATKPKHLTIGNQDNGQVFEDCVDWNREELEGLGAGIDHNNQCQ